MGVCSIRNIRVRSPRVSKGIFRIPDPDCHVALPNGRASDTFNQVNLIQLQNELKDTLRRAARESFDIELEQIAMEVPPRTELGDLAFPIAFELAKQIKQKTGEKRAPRAIAEALKSKLEAIESVNRVEVAGAGYLNAFFDRANLLADLTAPSQTEKQSSQDRKLMVEHTSVNPNKAAHIGHVRNSVIGDTFVRILQAAGNRVEVQNYIDNTGVQVADVVVGFMHIEKMDLDAIKELDHSLPDDRSFDYYCWNLYTQVGLFYRDGKADGENTPDKLK